MNKSNYILFSLQLVILMLSGCSGGEDFANPFNVSTTSEGATVALDTTFGDNNGIVVHHNAAGGNSFDNGQSIVQDSLDRLYVTGNSYGSQHDMVIWRYTSAGNLDTTFGGDINPVDGIPDGFVVHHGAAGGIISQDYGRSITLDSVGRVYVAGWSTNAAGNVDMVIWRYTDTGILDTTFGGDINPVNGIPDGFVVHKGAAGGSDHDVANSITLDPLGNVYATGYSTNIAGDLDMVIWRYTDTGILDATFGGDVNPVDGIPDGFVVHHNAAGGNSYDDGKSIALDPLGNIYVTGYSTSVGAGRDMAVWRYTNTGILDTTFGSGNGFTLHDSTAGLNNGSEEGLSITMDSSGRVYVAGTSKNAANDWDTVIWRYTSAGILDTTFGGDINPVDGIPDGFVVNDTPATGYNSDYAKSITLGSTGMIYVAGYSWNVSGDVVMVIYRYTDNGSLDHTFGGDLNLDSIPDGYRVQKNTAGGNEDYGEAIIIDSSGRINVTGSSENAAGDTDMVIWRYR